MGAGWSQQLVGGGGLLRWLNAGIWKGWAARPSHQALDHCQHDPCQWTGGCKGWGWRAAVNGGSSRMGSARGSAHTG